MSFLREQLEGITEKLSFITLENRELKRKNYQLKIKFSNMKREIEKHQERYIEEYDLLPGFKAGIHCGSVIAGEVGIIKRDITFSGDVLNTTSRIQGKCKEFNTEIIISDDLLKILPLEGKYTTQFLGSIKLRGKEKDVELSTLIPLYS